MKKSGGYHLEVIVFFSGAIVMILELVGSRILAPFFGTSIFVWTSLIGIILGCLSVGYLLGGKLADRNANYGTFAAILLAAALFTLAAGITSSPVLVLLQSVIKDIRLGTIAGTLLLFGVPGVLLGMVSPYAVRLKLENVETSGATIGRIYALSTIGSITGTFAAGFFLIALIGSTNILLVLAGALLALSLLAYRIHSSSWPKSLALFAALLGLMIGADFLFRPPPRFQIDVDTPYSRIWVYESVDAKTKRPLRNMTTDPRIIQSDMFLDRDDDLVYGYANFYRLASHFNPGFTSSLMIGGAGYAYPKDYLRRHRDALIDVVEIDPGMTKLARRYFNLQDDPRLRIIHEDGRTFLNRDGKTYDVILMDALKSFYSIPFQLITREAIAKTFDRLHDDGVLLINLIGSLEGDNGRVFRSAYAICQAIFPQLYVFCIEKADDRLVQNIMMVASKNPVRFPLQSADEELNRYLGKYWHRPIPNDVPLLTDDFAPVEHYNLQML
jgi:spermidine synthase